MCGFRIKPLFRGSFAARVLLLLPKDVPQKLRAAIVHPQDAQLRPVLFPSRAACWLYLHDTPWSFFVLFTCHFFVKIVQFTWFHR